MNKKQFVASVRALGISEPTREQWLTMYDVHVRHEHYSLETIVSMINGKRIVDNRRIPEKYKNDALPLEEIARFGASMVEKLKSV